MVTNYWKSHPLPVKRWKVVEFCNNFHHLKCISICWDKQKKAREDLAITKLESRIANLTNEHGKGYNSIESKVKLVEIEAQRARILLAQEQTWRLRGKGIWLQAGDGNTKLFHKFSNGRKACNTIWQLPLEHVMMANTHAFLLQLGILHFKQLFKSPPGATLLDIIRISRNFTRFMDPDSMEDLIKHVSLVELESTLKWFKRDRSPSLDGWPVEFYLTLFDILGPDLLTIVEECHTQGRLHKPINSTFIALIPKFDSPLSFNDFCPISLYNRLYKIIDKIIYNHIKPILSEHISLE